MQILAALQNITLLEKLAICTNVKRQEVNAEGLSEKRTKKSY